jgi:hypothetical protein
MNRYFLASILLWPLIWFFIFIILDYVNKSPVQKKKIIKKQIKQNIKNKIFQKNQKEQKEQEEQEQKKNKEGFTSYNDCTTQGYTKAFCIQNPRGMPGWCQCEDGTLGSIAPGFRGECVCNSRFW